jgi:hypothetical protein
MCLRFRYSRHLFAVHVATARSREPRCPRCHSSLAVSIFVQPFYATYLYLEFRFQSRDRAYFILANRSILHGPHSICYHSMYSSIVSWPTSGQKSNTRAAVISNCQLCRSLRRHSYCMDRGPMDRGPWIGIYGIRGF